MIFVDFFKKESVVSATPVLFMSSLAGIANATILFIINSVAMSAAYEDLNFRYLMMFISAFGIFIYCKHYALTHAAIIVEKLLGKVRLRILDKSRACDLKSIEDIGMAEIHTKLTNNVNTISEMALMGTSACQYAIMLVLCSVYIAWQSLPAFFGIAGIITLAVIYFEKKRKKAYEFLARASSVQATVFTRINGIFLGFKELKVNRNRSRDYFKDVGEAAGESEDLMIRTQLKFVSIMLVSEITFSVLLAGMVFLVPRFGSEYAPLVPRLVTSVLFIMGPVVSLVAALPMITRANLAIAEIYGLEAQLDAAGEPDSVAHRIRPSFTEISLEDIIFNYRDQYGNVLFTLDRINLKIKRGEMIFVVGGNGSGKSTVLKILTGLYYPESGNIRIDGRLLDRSGYQNYRELFSIIFTDFHLFEKLYGLEMFDQEKINHFIDKMELTGKTEFNGTGFSNIQLSTGQKKRLAVITALLFDSDIYVFDELAADQAPEFREYFYTVLLKEMKAQGKTIIVVSHDDRYFHVADRVIEMDYGHFRKKEARP